MLYEEQLLHSTLRKNFAPSSLVFHTAVKNQRQLHLGSTLIDRFTISVQQLYSIEVQFSLSEVKQVERYFKDKSLGEKLPPVIGIHKKWSIACHFNYITALK